MSARRKNSRRLKRLRALKVPIDGHYRVNVKDAEKLPLLPGEANVVDMSGAVRLDERTQRRLTNRLIGARDERRRDI